MTDKIQKIREELERLKEETSIGLSEHENGVEQGRMEIINALSIFLDSMQEEPVSNVWHDAQIDPPQAKKRILAINEYGFCAVDYAIIMAPYWPKVIKWAYIDDLLKLDNSCQSCENLQEETVSEDLKAAASREWYESEDKDSYADTFFDGYIKGANWQKQKDKKGLELLKEWFEDIAEKCEHLTSGNVSHNGKMIRGFARNCAEYIIT
jgi:hypothetical protein